MRHHCFGLALVVLGECLVAPPTSGQSVQFLGAGARATCGQWLEDRKSGNYFGIGNWVLGYLSGVASASRSLNPLNGLDSDAVSYWFDNYCRAHPIEKLTRAIDAFVREHPK